VQKLCQLDNSGERTLKMAMRKMGLSTRARGRLFKVARTIADLDSSEAVSAKRLAGGNTVAVSGRPRRTRVAQFWRRSRPFSAPVSHSSGRGFGAKIHLILPPHRGFITRKRYLLYLAIAVIVPAVLFGQSFTAAIRGVITDTSQAAVPGARVVVKDVDLEDRFGHRGDRTLPGAHRVLQQESEGAEESLSGCQARMLSVAFTAT
jgi:hypothetical protein